MFYPKFIDDCCYLPGNQLTKEPGDKISPSIHAADNLLISVHKKFPSE